MPIKVTFTVHKGRRLGDTFTYDGKESLIIGRQDDCSIVLPDATVSRYHCLIDIAPPSVMVRDFLSLNGTYLNGEKIGQRLKGMSAEEARAHPPREEFPLRSGERLGLGKDCELGLEVTFPRYCADCLREIEDLSLIGPDNMPICEECHQKRHEEQKAAKALAMVAKMRSKAQKKVTDLADQVKNAVDPKAKADAEKALAQAEAEAEELRGKEEAEKLKQQGLEKLRLAERAKMEAERERRNHRRCEVCGKRIDGDDGPSVCQVCAGTPLKVLAFLLAQAKKGQGDAKAIAGYRQVRMIGQGGMGQVWLVEEEATGKRMALKLMLAKSAGYSDSRKSFLREAYLACQLDHRNIVRHHKCGQSGDAYFIVLEYCQGGSLEAFVQDGGGKLDLDLSTNIMLETLDGLIYAHNGVFEVKLPTGTVSVNGIVHRDYKPSNIFFSIDGPTLIPKIGDFGLAKAFEAAGLSGHTNTGALAGTPVYMPRQQIINYKYSKPAVDVWAAAATYYYMLTGALTRDYQRGKDPLRIALTSPAVPIRKRDPDIPKRLAEVIDHALEEKPEIGVQSAGELKKLIEEAI
jgi:serine/threonine-protein kinase